MTGPLNAKAAPAGTRNGSQIAKHLECAFTGKSYSRNAKSATPVRDLIPLIEQTISEHGMTALEMPKRAAALHEAGHVVLYAVEGERIKSVRIKSRRIGGQLAWGGQTFGGQPWRADPSTDPAVDLRQARLTLAGVCAEATFDMDNFRQGSSLDELVLGQRLCGLAALKLLRNAQELMAETMLDVRETLVQHEQIVLDIAAALERHEWVRGRRLADMLGPLREAAE